VRRAFKTFFDDVRAHKIFTIYDWRFTISISVCNIAAPGQSVTQLQT
jgi:hypothetical protein